MYIVLTKPDCPFCDKAKAMLEKNNLAYATIDVTQPEYNGFIDFLKGNGVKTVPQIFQLQAGGYENLRADLLMDGFMDV